MSLLGPVALCLLSAPVVVVTGYLGAFVLLSGKPKPPPRATKQARFRVIVPAHNEEQGIGETVRSLRQLDYDPSAFSVLVVADNCSDKTAERAREAGAEVLERFDDKLRGKGYALHHAFERLPPEVDAVVVIDADTLVSPNLLHAFASRLEQGAHAVQADYAVRNPHQSWRTRMMAVAFGAFHIVRSRGREKLGLSAGLRGNGMCFTSEILKKVPHNAYSIVEDVEYGIRLGEAGCRVYYADEAHVYGEMVSSSAASKSQRARWEGGRKALREAHGMRLIKLGLARKDRVLFDLGFDVMVPPLSQIAVSAFGGLGLALGCTWFWGGSFAYAVVPWALSSTSVVGYVLRGWSVSGTGARGLADLALAPVYIVWKATLGGNKQTARADAPWVRTTREAEAKRST